MNDNDRKFVNNIMKQIKPEHESQGQENDLKLNRQETPDNSSTFFQKLLTSLSEGSVLGGTILYILLVINLIGATVFARRAGLSLTQSLMYKFHLDSIAFEEMTFLEVSILMSYFFTFIFGGLVVFALLKITAMLSKTCRFAYSHKLTRWIVVLFMTVFAAVSLYLSLTDNALLSLTVCKWMLPFCTFAGGLSMYCISLRSLDIS